MKFCPDCDPKYTVICDFCKHYDFNPDEDGHYVENGFCRLHQKPMQPWDGCEDFYCSSIDKDQQ